MQQKNAPSWRIYEYVIATDTLAPVIDPTTDPDPLTVNDVSPHYLPDGRIVFSSTRQSQSQGILLDEGKPQFVANNEANNEPDFVLEVMNADGTRRPPDLLQPERRPGRRRCCRTAASCSPAGTTRPAARTPCTCTRRIPTAPTPQLYYGANSHMTGTNNTVVEFMKPREMQNGSIMALIRQFSDTDFGGDLVIINGNQFVENTQPLARERRRGGPGADARHAQ